MKTIIIGAGIAGLSTYLALQAYLPSNNSDGEYHEIYIYEAHDVAWYLDNDDAEGEQELSNKGSPANSSNATFAPEAIGSATGIIKNGLAVLERLDEASQAKLGEGGRKGGLIDQMLRTGHPVGRWKIGCARGWLLANAKMVPEKRVDEGVAGLMISRQGMWKILLKEVVRIGGRDAIRKAVVKELVLPAVHGAGATVVLHDGTQDKADLVIGADGLRSIVRSAMFPRPDQMKQAPMSVFGWLLSWFRESPAAPADYVTPHYEGLVGVSSFVPSSLLTSTGHEPGTMAITFGPNGFFGHGLISTADPGTSEPLALATANPAPAPGSTGVYWSTFSSAKDAWPYHKGKSKPKPQDFDRAAALEGLISRHKHWKNPTIQEILKYASENPETGIEGFYPTWTTTPLPSWHRGNVVLVGDAAHALQPSSGQGACQALEDAEVLARCLRHFLDRQNGKEDAAEAACTKYEQIRMPRVKGIYDQSQRMSRMKNDMSWIEEMLMYGIVKLSMLFQDGAIEKLVGYDLPAEVEKALADS